MKPLLDNSAGGYYNPRNQLVPVSPGKSGYYTRSGEWKTSTGGYFDNQLDDWKEGLKDGYYSPNGQWISTSGESLPAATYGKLDPKLSQLYADLSDENMIGGVSTNWANLKASAMDPEY